MIPRIAAALAALSKAKRETDIEPVAVEIAPVNMAKLFRALGISLLKRAQ
jgi:hypothetical protein